MPPWVQDDALAFHLFDESLDPLPAGLVEDVEDIGGTGDSRHLLNREEDTIDADNVGALGGSTSEATAAGNSAYAAEHILTVAEQSQSRSLTPSSIRSSLSLNGDCQNHDTDRALADFKTTRKLEVRLPKSTLITPRARFIGWEPPASVVREHVALAELMALMSQTVDVSQKDFIEFELDQFAVYVHSKIYPYELRPLQHLCTKSNSDEFYFDGVLSFGDVRRFVERVPFRELPIGNYGISDSTVGDQIWIRSRTNASGDIFYKLKKPAAEYQRFHTPFLWIADLTKHVIDFCDWMTKQKKEVTLRHFRYEFIDCLQKMHKNSPAFKCWRKQHPNDDFRTSVVANIEFIWKEAVDVLPDLAHSLHVFRETKLFNQYLPIAEVSDKRNPVPPPTIVTPYIFDCFSHSDFGALLEPVKPTDGCGLRGYEALASEVVEQAAKVETTDAPDKFDPVQSELQSSGRRRSSVNAKMDLKRKVMIDNIKEGDTISTPHDDPSITNWRKETAKGSTDDHRWFGLVQKVHVSDKTGRTFDIIWLYRPVDTPCCKMVYPWRKELFLSDHCTCDGGEEAGVHEDEVIAVHSVGWFGAPEKTAAEFFVRQTYQVEQRRWVTLETKHMRCSHSKPEELGYKAGDTVLAVLASKDERSEVYEVVKVFKQGKQHFVRLRRLLRRAELEPDLPGVKANELVYTDEMVVVKPHRVFGKCLVRFFRPDDPIPCPYDRNGTANIFFITHRLEHGEKVCAPLTNDNWPTTMQQGFDPKRTVSQKLKGLDLFCGSGNFGRGLEEGGAISMHWTNDIWKEAGHTYMANSATHTKPFVGSVDDLLRQALEGKARVPRPGEVDFISAGSPCPGFSLLTANKTEDRQKKNRSLVASFASFVDFYRPKYGILENVLTIVQSGRGREEDAFSQLVCAIVGMGYQTQLVLGDAWSYGAPQSRSRVFLYFAAPGFRLPNAPRPSHSHFSTVKNRGLGHMTNGESFVNRSFDPTPFKYVSAGEATGDLPEIHDAKADCCIAYPDHRVNLGQSKRLRHQFSKIPIHPYGMSFAKAWYGMEARNNPRPGQNVLTPAERDLFPPGGHRVKPTSRGWGRLRPDGVFGTITTKCSPTDARTGILLHWREARPITILEARRAQGFLDHEVLLGSPVDQYEMVGNSVARPIALALGLQFREALLGSLFDDKTVAVRVNEVVEREVVESDPKEEADEEVEVDWEDDESDLFVDQGPDFGEGNEEVGPTLYGTPATSDSDAHVKMTANTTTTTTAAVEGSGSRKRPLSQSFAVELRVSKVQKQKLETIDLTASAEPVTIPAVQVERQTIVRSTESTVAVVDLTGDDDDY